jgi:hypothetical protein
VPRPSPMCSFSHFTEGANSIHTVWFLILFLSVFPSTFSQYLISVACICLLCLEDKGHDPHPYVIGIHVVSHTVSIRNVADVHKMYLCLVDMPKHTPWQQSLC